MHGGPATGAAKYLDSRPSHTSNDVGSHFTKHKYFSPHVAKRILQASTMWNKVAMSYRTSTSLPCLSTTRLHACCVHRAAALAACRGPAPLVPPRAASTPVHPQNRQHRSHPRTAAEADDVTASVSTEPVAPAPTPPSRPSSATAVADRPPSQHAQQQQQPAQQTEFEFACPICQTTTFKMTSMPKRPDGLYCSRCQRTFTTSEKYLDLTLSSGVKTKVYNRREWMGTELFRSPLVSFAYERGWRQGFSWAGFPGVDKEFEVAMDYLRPAYGSVLVDMSCGSGLFSRRFARSNKFTGVVAADFSESMLEQTRNYFKEDGTMSGSTPVTLLRADVGRLPFATASVAAMHAGAALHCWPNPQAALAEISRVLRPGGVFVASTFLVASAPLGQALGNDEIVRPLNQVDVNVSRQYKWWEEQELRDLCKAVGLVDFKCTRSWRFIMLSARKPWGGEGGEDA